jgi:hypothetical protein
VKAAEFKRWYRVSIAPQFDKLKDPAPELLKAIIDLERMVAELCECDCSSGPFSLPRHPPVFPPSYPDPCCPPKQPWKLPDVWCRYEA